jgi:mannose-6-phosphate isomerase-like protein (cupin superfamily)
MTDFDNKIVRKPWGYEYRMYENGKIGIWFLHIHAGRRTSLHCHPGKKTGYILLAGEARVAFLNGAVTLTAVSKLILREGLFHSTHAISPEGVDVIEVERPPDKGNLVRLEDAYGRENQPYEGPEATAAMDKDCIRLQDPPRNGVRSYAVKGVTLVLERLDDPTVLRTRPPEEILLVLDGGLFSRQREPIVAPGDVVTTATFNRLADSFRASSDLALMSVRAGAVG